MRIEKIEELEKRLALDELERYEKIKIEEFILEYEIQISIFCKECNEYILSYGIDYDGKTSIYIYGSCPHLKTYLHPKTEKEIPEDIKNGIKIVETDKDIAFIVEVK
jgi:hypothetical protein